MAAIYSFPLADPTSPISGGSLTEEDPESLPFVTLALDPATGDLATPVTFLRGVDALAQRLRTRYKFFLGEWFLDIRQGIPYFRDILVKNPDPSLIQSIFRKATLTTPGVLAIRKFGTALTEQARVRRLNIDPLELVVTGNKIFRAQPDEFIITTP